MGLPALPSSPTDERPAGCRLHSHPMTPQPISQHLGPARPMRTRTDNSTGRSTRMTELLVGTKKGLFRLEGDADDGF